MISGLMLFTYGRSLPCVFVPGGVAVCVCARWSCRVCLCQVELTCVFVPGGVDVCVCARWS